jgi:hypothetical protein
MTDNVEELLREGIDRLTAGADVPAGLLTRARRRNRQRRRAIWTAAVAGTAVVAAAAVVATSSPQPHSGSLQQQDISYVVSRAQQALAGLTQANAIQVVEETASQPDGFGLTVLDMNASDGTGAQPAALGGVQADRMVDWTSPGLSLYQGFSADGKLVFATSFGNVTSRAGKKVDEAYGAAYSARIQWHSPLVGGVDLPATPTTCQDVLGTEPGDYQTQIAKALSCHLYSLAGRQEIDGVNTIKLVLKPQPGLNIGQTLWIDPSSYLPIREAYSDVQPDGKTVGLTDNFQWLPRNAANLAALRAAVQQSAIPAGFTSLPADDLLLPAFTPAG